MSLQLLRLELRRNTALFLLPLLAALAALSPAWRHLSALALWPGRSIDAQTALQGVGPLFAGIATWVAGREHRRGMKDILATTSRSPWSRLLTAWAATTLWGVLLYLLIVAVILGVTAQQATWGAPVSWPLLAGLLELPALAALGCALGYHIPSRFTPPLVGVGVFVSLGLGITLVNHGSRIGLLAPGYPNISFSVWYASPADLGLIQAMFLLGITAICLASLDLSQVAGTGRRVGEVHGSTWLLITIGLILTLISIALAMSSRVTDGVVSVPLFGGSTTTTPLPYTPACRSAALPVCVHPAYRRQLAETTTLLNNIAAPLLGLPGAPIRAIQQPGTTGIIFDKAQPVLSFTPIDFHDPTNPPQLVQSWQGQLAMSLVTKTGGPTERQWSIGSNKAQDAVALYLLDHAGVSFDPAQFDRGQDVRAAEQRFAALPATVRHAWLRTHYTLLRQGQISLQELP